METLVRVVVAVAIVLLFLLFLVVALPFRLVGLLTEGDPAGERESEAASTCAARAAAVPASEGVQPRV
jgi:Na+-transporting methylmalonyl-CoA/oxaloacetate decarboxylase gamma subunit